MTCANPTSPPALPMPRTRRLPPQGAFVLKASMALSFLAGSSAPTPLYAVYQAQWGFSSTMLTLVFGVYAIAVLLALLVAGRLSDHVGRRPVLMAAAAAQALTMVVFALAGDVGDLLLARVLQGLSTGAAVAAVGAGLLDLDRARGAVANAVAPMLGTAVGGILAGSLVQYLPQPTHLVYAVMGAVFVLQGVALAFVGETAERRPGALASLRPQLSVPAHVVKPLLLVTPAIVAAWAVAGFYGSLGPTLLRSLAGSASFLLGGLALFVLAGSGALAVLALRQRSAQRLLRIGTSLLPAGLAVVMVALATHSVGVFLAGTAMAGVGFGTAFQGALRTLVGPLAAHQRAGVLSALFILSYLAMGVPAMVAGWRLAQGGDILLIAQAFDGVVLLLAVLALLGTFVRQEAAASS
ncbi:MFS transporter [Azohydromonas lata]|uniref:MFS transporter n=1 Tax=Azohydromonas lata TaxID=45677 RepID=A0ABU5IBD0_9BURK|nr:MFS transporter [Azohydromonas lata]MDZ5456278.1 MFS transporter [Azohydromonas lata]